MKYYFDLLKFKSINVRYVEAHEEMSDIRKLLEDLVDKGIRKIFIYDVSDDWLDKRIKSRSKVLDIEVEELPSQIFLNTKADLKNYFDNKKRYFQTDFYIQQRKKFGILVDDNLKPTGGKWSFDDENRLKYPKDKVPPSVIFPPINQFVESAIKYVESHFPQNHGEVPKEFRYPCTHEESEAWFDEFLKIRFYEFGDYEDAIVSEEIILHHSLLSPLINIGLLTPRLVIEKTLDYAAQNNVPINSLEGFVRQIIGWREFIRGVYVYKRSIERTINFWRFNKKISPSFYKGDTGIIPLDDTIKKVCRTGYCHHIERLMILGNFMVLAEIDPNEVYRWFMEMFIDAYDWVMVPNVYGMSQFADGGLMATKPYISGSSYILKMSNYSKAPWCEEWDALFWTFMDKHRDFFLSNPRLGMLIKTYDKMSIEKKETFAKAVSRLEV
jgi:deoxyribodipyrimidine photolyase-related protein